MKKIIGLFALIASVGGLYLYSTQDKHHTYEVIKGDSLHKIAKQYSVSVDELRQWNQLSGDLIEIGQLLLIKKEISNIPSPPVKAKKSAHSDIVMHKMGMTAAPTKKMPKAKRCLAGPDVGSLDDERGMMTNNGLSSHQISSSMNKFFPQLSDCMPDVWPTANIEVDFNVGCNGLVSYVRIVKDDNMDFEIQSCLEDAFQYAEFPAHDLPDGMDFTYPIQFAPG